MSMNITDRRKNPPNKSLDNRQRYIRKQRVALKGEMQKAVKSRKLGDVGKQDVVIPDITEPTFRGDPNQGKRSRVLPGGGRHIIGDEIDREEEGGWGGEESPTGEGYNDFKFLLTYEEFLDLFFEDMGLPDLFKQAMLGEERTKPAREGFSLTGSPDRMDMARSAAKALARRIALGRPSLEDLEEAEAKIEELKKRDAAPEELEQASAELAKIEQRRAAIPYLDPIDVRYRRFAQKPAPSPQAVMFCMMDVSGSMDEVRLDLAKRFFMLLNVMLMKRYKRVEVVFIRHTHEAKEVNEDEFFNSPETGGTVVSTALEVMQRVIKERYPLELWNVYGAQISDGENFSSDNKLCRRFLTEGPDALLQTSQYFAYLEVGNEEQRKKWEEYAAKRGFSPPKETNLWQAYAEIASAFDNFAMQKATKPTDIWPVFKELFQESSDKPRPSMTQAATLSL